jgi:hypothetical protein
MSLENARIWLVTRGAERASFYQDALVEALRSRGAASVEVVGFEGVLVSAAFDLGARATDLIGSAADRIAKGLRIDRWLVRGDDVRDADDAGDEPAPADSGADLIVVDDPSLIGKLGVLPSFRRGSPLLIGLLDDFKIDPRWRASTVHALIVPHEDLKSPHVSPEAAEWSDVAGPPVASTYTTETGTAEARSKVGLPTDATALLVFAERMDAETLDRLVFQLSLVEAEVTYLFHYGDSVERAELLRDAAANYGLQANMFGDVPDPEIFAASADFLLVAADDPGLFEYVLSKRSIVAVGAEQGSTRTAFLRDRAALIWVEDVLQLGARLETILETGSGIDPTAAGPVSALGTADVADAVVRLWKAREKVRYGPKSAPDAPKALVKRGRFEAIGAPSPGVEATGQPAISLAEAKDQIAALIVKERRSDRGLSEAVRERDKWLGRLDLAAQGGDSELESEAQERLERARSDVARLNSEIETIRRAKAKLVRRARGSSAGAAPATPSADGASASARVADSDHEARFRRMEIDRDLARLRAKLDEES